MSEEGGFIDVESDEVPELGGEATASSSGQNSNDPLEYHSDKRAHHNLLERRRRDHIKDSFHGLRDCIPSLQGEKVSRAHILNKATEYIRQMQRGGSMREGEIVDLKKKNEVLEEQVRVIEQNKAVGSEQKIEEVLESVARQVQQKQRQRDNHQEKASQGGSKGEKTTIDLSGRDLTRSLTMATRATPTTVGSGADPKKAEGGNSVHSTSTSNALNLLHLAGNLKNAQQLLSVLQKNLPQNAILVKSLASKALSATAKQVQTNATAAALPRGIVTATTVPKGSSLPPNLASALQQKTTGSSSKPVLVGGKASQLANHLTSQLKPTSATPTSSSGVNSMETSQTGSETSLESLSSQMNDSGVQNSNKSTATQVLEATTLLQQQGGGEMDGVSASTLPSITAELIAQCFLNLPGNSVTTSSASVASGGSAAGSDHEDVESVAMDTDAAVSAANVLAALGESLCNANNHLHPFPPPYTTSPSPSLTNSPLPLNSAVPPPSLLPSAATTSPSPLTTPTSNETRSTSGNTPPVAKKPKLGTQL